MKGEPHDRCAQTLREGMAPFDVTVSTSPPLVIGPYTTAGYCCPHGTCYWIEPTGEQIAQWATEGAK